MRAGTTRVSLTTASTSARQELRQVAEDPVVDGTGGAVEDEQARLVAAVGGMLRDQLGRQVVVELTGLHPVRTVASACGRAEHRSDPRGDDRPACARRPRRSRGASPRSKGLSNNAIRRLERLEGLIESERNARVDDLGLLVDLLTDGWRAMDARLARIEAALAAEPSNVVRLRESA